MMRMRRREALAILACAGFSVKASRGRAQSFAGPMRIAGSMASGGFPYPLDLGIPFTGAWGTYPLSAASANLFTLIRASDSATQAIGRSGQAPDFATINSFLTGTTGKFTSLNDQSGGGNDASQSVDSNRPRYNTHLGLAVADCYATGGGKFSISGPTLAGQNLSLYLVFHANDHTFSGVTALPVMVPYLSSGAGTFGLGPGTRETRTTAYSGEFGWGSPYRDTAQGAICAGNCSLNVMCVEASASSTNFTLNEMVASLAASGNSALALGVLNQYGGSQATGTQLIAILVGPGHTANQQGAVINSLRMLLGDAPKTKLVLFDGDSITAGYSTVSGLGQFTDLRDASWPYLAMGNIADKAVLASNRAISSSCIVDGGDATEDLTLWAPKKIDAYLNAQFGTKQILGMFAGHNDCFIRNAPGAETAIYADLIAYCAARRSAGWNKIVVGTIPPGQDFNTATLEAIRVGLNALILADGNTHWDATCDVAAQNWQPGGSSDWTTNYQDGTHPNAAGRQLFANACQPTIAGYL